jgi:hypothetical protein
MSATAFLGRLKSHWIPRDPTHAQTKRPLRGARIVGKLCKRAGWLAGKGIPRQGASVARHRITELQRLSRCTGTKWANNRIEVASMSHAKVIAPLNVR